MTIDLRSAKPIIKKLIYVVVVLVILVLGIGFTGIRLDPISAGRTSISRGAMLIRQVSFGQSEKVDIFNTHDGYATTLVKKWGPFWRKNTTTLSGKASSKMNIISFINFDDPKLGSGTVLAVLSHDKNVSYLRAGPNSVKYSIKPHVVSVLSWNQLLTPTALNAVAYSKNNRTLYKIKNAKIKNGIAISIPIKFYSVN
ncbi:hypothetical protein [Alicyclobacillus dauci]|uniref:Uncharacterized protein n=1 Tax=Alicyclobacillus dauci TaxID=1475485 RepID=A0ABY6Z527_9BACL|nr:hypothetical protein [Alicyclobacillus dauci]WAH37762.1 hypothetical protein NZD86_04465 [Alicyclobacillus dauci]